jgi:hypothetical protein
MEAPKPQATSLENAQNETRPQRFLTITERPPRPVRSLLARILSGIEAGVIGGLAMLALLAAAALLRRHVWWETPNLLGSTFYGTRAFRSGPGVVTVAGSALHLVITGVAGAIFGVACGNAGPRRRLVLLGALAGLFWYYLAGAVFWSRINPLVPLYSPQPATVLSHALLGVCLGYMVGGVRPPAGSPVPEEAEPLEAEAAPDAVK